MRATHIVVGGGSGGAVVAARLSEKSSNQVVLLEAGTNYEPHQMPPEILEPYARRVFANPNYFWPKLTARRVAGDDMPERMRMPSRYEQAKVIGGGSSINGQVGLRGAPADYDRWHELGAAGWDWNSVLPYFKKLERDYDFDGPLHGKDGPIPIERIDRSRWDGFTKAVCGAWEHLGYQYNPDMNGHFSEGYSPLPLTTDHGSRVSTAIGYLTPEVRKRPNLRIIGNARAQKLIFAGKRVTGVEYADPSGVHVIDGDTVCVSAGALHSPWLLQISGVGPAAHLKEMGIPVVIDRPGVGGHLLEHPSITVSSFMPESVRNRYPFRINYVYLRYSSQVPEGGGTYGDMMMGCITKFSWHAIGERLGTLSCYVAKAYSEGTVRLASPAAGAEPDVNFRWLSDMRDRVRLMEAFRIMANILVDGPVSELVTDPFATSYSDRARALQPETLRNKIITKVGGALMDLSPMIRKFLIHNVISDGPDIDLLLKSAEELEKYVRGRVVSAWHPSGSCKMGAVSDPMAVCDPTGKVIGAENLYVADASVFPEIPVVNINVPTIMVGERVADFIKAAT